MPRRKHIKWFKTLGIKDVPTVGGKNASLGEMIRKLTPKGVYIPDGFAVTAQAYFYFVQSTGIDKEIRRLLRGLNTHDTRDLAARGKAVRELILGTPMPEDLTQQIVEAYVQLSKQYRRKNVDVAVRSSATAEDLPDASFAGQQETFLNIHGEEALLRACHHAFASLFTDRAISYRVDKRFNHFKVGLSIGVQKMVRSDKASSGVMFSIDTETGFKDAVLINGAWGLGENIVQGTVNPDEFYVFKPFLGKKGVVPILSRHLGQKRVKMVYTQNARNPVKNIRTTDKERNSYALSDKEILQLSEWAVVIEKHYKKPMDMEWAKDGETGQLFIVQARPETVQSQKDVNFYESYHMGKRSRVLAQGMSVGSKIGAGKVHVIKDTSQIHSFKEGEVLVTDMTDPDWEPIMKIASAIVTNRGGRTCHAAIVSRELGIPAVVGTENATKVLKNNKNVTVSCAEGEAGFIYDGVLPFHTTKTNIGKVRQPKHTKVMMNIGSPDIAFATSFIPNTGVGLAREEFIVNSYIKIHPQALLEFNKVKDQRARKQIEDLTRGYKSKKEYFVQHLSSGVAMIAAAFYPKDVILRLSDFKTNEYANLIGGTQFEPVEDNPMLGWRGASRYYDPDFADAFAMECEAIKRVRNEMGLKNLKIMVPVVRTVSEAKKVIKVLADNGLKRGKDGLQFYMMVEVPSNVILAEDFAKLFDGFSIGTNDLTQFTLAVDRDSELVAAVYDENDAAVKTLVSQVIAVAKKTNTKIGICGQAPSDKPEFATFLLDEGIDTISLNPDTVIPTTVRLAKHKKRRKRRK